MQRILKISKFRNIGLEEPETLVLNHSMEKGKIGELIILIGANNSGKSNVLDALTCVSKGQLRERDVTTLSFSPEDMIPSVNFGVRNKDEYIYYNMTYGQQANCQIGVNDPESVSPSREVLLTDLKEAYQFLTQSGTPADHIRSLIETLSNDETEVTPELVNEVVSKISNGEQKWFARFGRSETFAQALPANGYWRSVRAQSGNPLDKANAYCMNKFGIPFLPNIIIYQEQSLDSNNLRTSPREIQNSLFFRSLFKAIGVNFN